MQRVISGIVLVGQRSIVLGQEIHVTDGVLLMFSRSILLPTLIRQEFHGQVHIVGIPDRIRLIDDEILVELIISIVLQKFGNALTFIIERQHVKRHILAQVGIEGILLDEIIDNQIVHLVGNMTDDIRFSRFNAIIQFHLVLMG